MPDPEFPAAGLHGLWRDRLLRPGTPPRVGPVRNNAIVGDCRRILAAFMGGETSSGIQGLRIGAGDSAWDAGGPPPATPSQTAMVDPNPFTVPATQLQFDFVDDQGSIVAGITNRLQIIATLGAGEPPWPDADHPASSLREFGLVGAIGGTPALINYVTHPVIHKDAASTLERTLWLVF